MTKTIPAEVIEKMAQAAEIYGNANIPEALKAAEAVGWVMVPAEITREMLYELAREVYPADWQAGKALQAKHPYGHVIPKHEYEAAVGKYERMIATRPKVPDAQD